MDTKICKECSESIKSEAKKCPNCQTYQRGLDRFVRSTFGGSLIGVVLALTIFSWITSSMFQNEAVYNPDGMLTIEESSFQFKDDSCGTKVTVIGLVKNASEIPLSDIVFDVEFYDIEGNVVDVINDTLYDLVVPSKTEKRFKLSGSSGARTELYSSHKVFISRAEPDEWP